MFGAFWSPSANTPNAFSSVYNNRGYLTQGVTLLVNKTGLSFHFQFSLSNFSCCALQRRTLFRFT